MSHGVLRLTFVLLIYITQVSKIVHSLREKVIQAWIQIEALGWKLHKHTATYHEVRVNIQKFKQKLA